MESRECAAGGQCGADRRRASSTRSRPSSAQRPLPKAITVDHGTEFTSKALDEWAYRRGVALDFIRPGKPVENAFIESFNGRLRDECLNVYSFESIAHAQAADRRLAARLQSPSSPRRARSSDAERVRRTTSAAQRQKRPDLQLAPV